MSKREWIDKAFKDAVDAPKGWDDPDNPQREWVNSLLEKEFEFYKQLSKVKPCEEKINWWIESPKNIPRLKVEDILPYLSDSEQIEFIARNPFAFMSAEEARRDATVQNIKIVKMWADQWHLCLEVER